MKKIINIWPILLCRMIYVSIYSFIYKYVCFNRCKKEFEFFKNMAEERNIVCLTTDIDFSKLYIEKTENFGRALIELCTKLISTDCFPKKNVLELKKILRDVEEMLLE